MAGTYRSRNKPQPRWAILSWLIFLVLLLSSCGSATQTKTYTVGVVNYVPFLDQVLGGFKARMAELGYVEGANITYIYHGVTAPDPETMDREVKSLLEQDVDLFLTMGTLPTLTAKHAVDGTEIPVLFAPVINPVEEGAVESINRPGGNVTGVQNGHTIAKALEWLHRIVPAASEIHVLYHPDDEVARTSVRPLPDVASTLGIELVLDEARSPEDALATIKALPEDAALFFVPSPSLEPLGALIEAAAKRGIPVGSSSHSHLQAGAVVTYAAIFSAMGEQAARMADQILKGTKPADLPVETAELFLNINLNAAQAVGVDIPDATLRQAHTVIR